MLLWTSRSNRKRSTGGAASVTGTTRSSPFSLSLWNKPTVFLSRPALGTSLSTPQVPYGESAERSTPHRNLVKGWGRRRGANDAGLRTDEDRRAELEQRLEVSERPLRNANAARRDAPADRRRIVRAVDRELVAARPSRGQARLDAADAE